MSYLLQGSGAILGPCFSSLVGRELARVAPCVCIRCSKLISLNAERLQQLNTRQFSSLSPAAASPSNLHIHNNFKVFDSPFSSQTCLQSPSTPSLPRSLGELRTKFPDHKFREQYLTRFTGPLPVLGSTSGPVSVHLNFTCAPDVNYTGIQYRFLHTSPRSNEKASSKLEETVIRLKERQAETLAEISKVEDLEKKIKNVIEKDEQLSQAVTVSVEQKKQLTTAKKSIWQRFVEEVKHYYSGFKLLFLDVKVSSKIIYKVLHGKTLSRRENRQLVRTVSDLFRLVPFSVFIIVPFMELLLPVALKLFPGMLPSTFTSQDEREVKMRRALKAKLEYAKFLQKTLDEMGPTSKGYKSESARGFVTFYNEVKTEGTAVTNSDILKFSKLFEDEITLDNMTRAQLVALCRLLELTPIGTNAFLRFQLEMQLRKLKADDRLISREGIDALSVAELQTACKERGMRAFGLTKEKLSVQLKQWIELSTNEKVPPSLLLLSRTLYLPESIDSTKQIAAAVGALPESAATGAKAKLGEREGKIENVTRLEVIKAEQAKIEEEAAEQKRLETQRSLKEAEEREKQTRIAQEALERAIEEEARGVPPPPASPTADSIVTEGVSILRKATVSADGAMKQTEEPALLTSDDLHIGHVIQEVKAQPKVPLSPIQQELSSEDLKALKNAIDNISKEKGSTFINEHDVLHELKQELTDYQEDLGELKAQAQLSGRKDLTQSKGAARLFTRVNKMLNNINTVVDSLETKEKDLTVQIDKLGEVGASTGDQEGHLVTVQELIQAVRGLQDVSDSSRLERIGEVVARMDDDSDGIVKVEHVNKVIELLGQDNVNMSTKQVKQIIELIGKEEMLEVEGRIEKLLGRMPSLQQTTDKIQLIKQAEELKDTATDLTETVPEPHIQQLFTPDRTEEEAAATEGENKELVLKREQGSDQQEEETRLSKEFLLTRELKNTKEATQEESETVSVDNSVKDVTDAVEKTESQQKQTEHSREEKDEKIVQKNGSKH